MNEIQKFKQGRKILKAQDGTKTYYEVTERPKITVTRGGEEHTHNYYRKVHNGRWAWGQYDGEGTFTPITKQVTLDDGTILNINGSKSSVGARNAVKNAKVIERGYMDANGNKTPLDAAPQNTGGNAGNKPAVRRTGTNWGNEFTNFMGGLSQEQQDWLKQNGLDNAQALQTYLDANNYYEGGSNSRNVDNKFGKNSKAAWNKFVASGIMGKNRDQEIYEEKQKEVEPVVDAPDPFGYRTSNTYEGDDFASKLKGMGIRSNADLINFMHNSGKEGWKGDAWQTQFRSDVDRALGGDYSDANIRKTFHTKNGWGGGFLGGGDFADFQNALQTNAGVWNGMYDRKQEEARMDAGRQQYAAKQAQQYAAPQLAKPTVENPANKYMVGKTGSTTLGNAGSGTMGKPYNWMEAAAQTGYLPQQEEETEQEFVPEDWMFGAYKSGYMPQQ